MTAYAFISYGLGGAALDPSGGEAQLVAKINALGVDTMASPYLYTDVQTITTTILNCPKDAKIIVGGDSFGANVAPWIAQNLQTERDVDYLFGFQPSQWGAKYDIPDNVIEALCIWNPTWVKTLGLGNYQWQLTAGNSTTNLRYIETSDSHPGDNDSAMQDIIVADIKRIIGASS